MPDYGSLRILLFPFGGLRPQLSTDWTGTNPLAAEVAEFYEQIGPWGETYHESVGPAGLTFPVGGNPVCIPPLHKLAGLQAGYAWAESPDKALSGWNGEWLVIAEQGGDPFIFDASNGHILFALHGMGSWTPQFFASDLITALGAIATVAKAHESLDEHHFSDGELLASGMDIITERLSTFLGGEERAKDMLLAWRYYM